MPSYPLGSVQISLETKLLLARNKVGIRGVKVLLRGRRLLLAERTEQIRRVRKIGVAPVQRLRIRVALQHAKEAM
jgi:hypothetical protein